MLTYTRMHPRRFRVRAHRITCAEERALNGTIKQYFSIYALIAFEAILQSCSFMKAIVPKLVNKMLPPASYLREYCWPKRSS